MERVVLSERQKNLKTKKHKNKKEAFRLFGFSVFLSFFRYRFFFFAGFLPYLLGQSLAYYYLKFLNWQYFWLGLAGVFLVLSGVELFNEYFDARAGGDRIFSPQPIKVPYHFLPLGLLCMFLAFLIALYFAFKVSWVMVIFAFLGFLGAYFYVGPPLKWAYRGLGEIVIALMYGPLMILGSFYLQANPYQLPTTNYQLLLFVSLLCSLSLLYLTILNEVPDYYQDKLIGKRNLVVRWGKKKSLKFLFLVLVAITTFLLWGIIREYISPLGIISFLFILISFNSLIKVNREPDNLKIFLPAVNRAVLTYAVIVVSLVLSYAYR